MVAVLIQYLDSHLADFGDEKKRTKVINEAAKQVSRQCNVSQIRPEQVRDKLRGLWRSQKKDEEISLEKFLSGGSVHLKPEYLRRNMIDVSPSPLADDIEAHAEAPSWQKMTILAGSSQITTGDYSGSQDHNRNEAMLTGSLRPKERHAKIRSETEELCSKLRKTEQDLQKARDEMHTNRQIAESLSSCFSQYLMKSETFTSLKSFSSTNVPTHDTIRAKVTRMIGLLKDVLDDCRSERLINNIQVDLYEIAVGKPRLRELAETILPVRKGTYLDVALLEGQFLRPKIEEFLAALIGAAAHNWVYMSDFPRMLSDGGTIVSLYDVCLRENC